MSTAPARGKLCPDCGRLAPADASLCPMCFRRLDEVPPTDVVAPAGGLTRARAAAGAASGVVRRHPRLALTLAVVVLLVGYGYLRYFRPISPLPAASTSIAAAASADAWPTADGGAGLDRATPASPPIDGAVAWAQTLPAPAVTAPVVASDTIYLGLADARLVAFDARDGSERWSLAVAGEIDSAPVVVDGTLFLTHRSGRLIAVDAATGAERWTVGTGSPVFASPAVADGVVYVASFAALLGIDAASGEVLWRRPLDAGFIRAAPAVAGTHLLIATNADVRFFDRRTGVEHYAFALPAATQVSGNDGVALAFHETLYGFEPDTQTPWWWGVRGAWANFYVMGLAPEVPVPPQRWSVELARNAYPPVLGDDHVYVAHASGQLIALDVATGAERWRATTDPAVAAPVLSGSGLLVLSTDALTVIDPASGAARERRSLPGAYASGFAVTARTIVIQTGEARDGVTVLR